MLLNRFYSMAVCFDDMLLVYIVILSPSLLVSSLTEMLACEFYCQWTSRSAFHVKFPGNGLLEVLIVLAMFCFYFYFFDK